MEPTSIDPTHDNAESTHSEPLSPRQRREVLPSRENAKSAAPRSHRRRIDTVIGAGSILANSGGWAAYSFGKKLNQLRWRLELFPFSSCSDVDRNEIVSIVYELVSPLRVMIGDSAAAPIERVIFKKILAWRESTRTEWYADNQNETIKRYWKLAALAADEDFDDIGPDVSEAGEDIAGEIRRAVMKVLVQVSRI
jgi:hypothetical protein